MHSRVRTVVAVILGLSITPTIFAQGTVIFDNTVTTLVILGLPPPFTPISGPAGSYYFGLLISPSSNGPFTFTGNYATNSATDPGRFIGGTQVVNGWAPGTTMAWEVAGWSSNLGPKFQPGWLVGDFGGLQGGVFGSQRGEGTAGAGNASPFPLYGGVFTPAVGIVLFPVPEPSTASLFVVGAGMILFCRIKRKSASAQSTCETVQSSEPAANK